MSKENNAQANTKILKVVYPVVFLIFIGSEIISKIKRFDPVEVDGFFEFAKFFGECLFSIIASALLGLLTSFILSAVIETITPKITAAHKNSDTVSFIAWVFISLCILCVLLYGVYLLYRPHLFTIT